MFCTKIWQPKIIESNLNLLLAHTHQRTLISYSKYQRLSYKSYTLPHIEFVFTIRDLLIFSLCVKANSSAHSRVRVFFAGFSALNLCTFHIAKRCVRWFDTDTTRFSVPIVFLGKKNSSTIIYQQTQRHLTMCMYFSVIIESSSGVKCGGNGETVYVENVMDQMRLKSAFFLTDKLLSVNYYLLTFSLEF